jgi:hypothetical protein
VAERTEREGMLMDAMPEPIELLKEGPLYRRYLREDGKIWALRNFKGPIDSYCAVCGEDSIFHRSDKTPGELMAGMVSPSPGMVGMGGFMNPERYSFSMEYHCSRDITHELNFYFQVDKESLMKVGEYPSRLDRAYPEMSQYKKELGEYYAEFRSALLLNSHGIGIGSFVYLRRVLERVVENVAKDKYKDESEWDWEVYRKAKRNFGDVLSDLKEDLPDFLAENRLLYTILSKGVHELDEEECLRAFDTVKKAIEEILDEEVQRRKKVERRKEISKGISDLASQS